MSTAVTFRRCSFAQDALRLACVRAIVFIAEQNCPFDEEFDGLDDAATQILGERAGEPVACGRIRLVEPRLAKLERLAVLASLRRLGHGRALLDYMIHTARAMGATGLTLNAQLHAQGFYEAAGFVAQGPVFDEVGIAHRKMTRAA
ncbi:MAG: GNAT family N-acetyltransferase [Burkholderiaceae bacterium]